MSYLQEMHYKQRSPQETVNILKSILEEMGVNVDEKWQPISSIGTYALRLNFEGTNIGTNGKGVTKDYARASAYAEFLERYQNDILGPQVNFGEKMPYYISPDEKLFSAEEIVSDNNSFIKQYFELRQLGEASIEKKTLAFYEVQKIDYLVHNLENRYICLPFFSIRDNRIVYLPKSTYTLFYGSNGMCAGNSTAEAIVQGLSEIIERVVQKRIFIEKPCLPDVPEEYIKKFPYVYSLLQKLKTFEKDGYRFFIKDCSFGGKYPVAALIFFQVNTGRFGIKLGCHPDFGVAIERTLTEATQGQDLSEYAKRSHIDFSNFKVDDWKNIYNSYKFGMGQYPYQIFDNNPTYKFTPTKDVSELGNEEIMRSWIDEIISDGYEIYIRDVSTLGFPSYHIIIPGMSEMLYPDDMKFRATNTRYYISKILCEHPEKINKDNINYFIATMEYFLGNAYENTMESYYGVVDIHDIPCEDIHCGCVYFISMCYAMIGDYVNASKKMDFVLKLAERGLADRKINNENYSFLTGIKYYFDAMQQFDLHSKAIRFIKVIFSKSITEKIDDIFHTPELILAKQYPGTIKNGISNNEKYSELYEKIVNYTIALRKKQSSNVISQKGIS